MKKDLLLVLLLLLLLPSALRVLLLAFHDGESVAVVVMAVKSARKQGDEK